MKRHGRLRRRSLKNSNRHLDVRLRGAYLRCNPACEFCSAKPVDPHHIAGGSPKLDNWSNLISLCRRCHDWCHAEPIVGKLRCWEIKLRKGELVEHEVDRALRMLVRGWLDSDKVKAAVHGTRWESVRMHLAESLDFVSTERERNDC